MKRVLLDSSSAILLQKTVLLDTLFKVYQVILTESVYQELTNNDYKSASIFKENYSAGQFSVIPMAPRKAEETTELLQLNKGERETIQQFINNQGDFIMLDDGKAARYCMKNELPFVNALLFPLILFFAGKMTVQTKEEKVARIIEIGRYSEKIIEIARGFNRNDLVRFLP